LKLESKNKVLRPELHSAQLFYSTNHISANKPAAENSNFPPKKLALEVHQFLKLEKTNYLNNNWLSHYFANWDSYTSDTPFKSIQSVPSKSIIEKDFVGEIALVTVYTKTVLNVQKQTG